MNAQLQDLIAGRARAALAPVLDDSELLLGMDERRALSSDVYSAGVTAAAIVRPRTRERLAAAVAAAVRAGFALVVRGGGMSYTGGYLPPRADCIIVDTSALDRIIEINTLDMYVTVEAGVTWKRIHEALLPTGYRLPFFGTFSGAAATVGGGLSNGALFLGTARHGTAADCMLGMELVLADGSLLNTGQAAFRNVTKPFYRTYGPDLAGLFVHDCGTLGIKAAITMRLIEAPQYSGYLSFVFPGMEPAAEALSAVARTGAAEEAYVFDPQTTRKNLATADLVSGARTVAKVVRKERTLWRGLKSGAAMAAGGRDFISDEDFSLHVVCTGRSEAALEADLAACRECCERVQGREIVNTIPKAVRANLFPPPDAVLGPKGDRWAALNAKVAHSDAGKIIRAAREALEPYEPRMKRHGVWMSHLLIAVGTHAFSFEPVFHWYDEWLPMHERMPAPEVLAKLERPVANLQARELVHEMRARLTEVFAELGAASNQIGRTYPYMENMQPRTAELLRALKRECDPAGVLNPGALGL